MRVSLRSGLAAALAFAFAFALLAAPQSQAASFAYEPNDSPSAAAGPLLHGGVYAAAVEHSVDRDLYFFHVTSPLPAAAEVTLANLGGGAATSDLRVSLLDRTGAPLAALSYIRAGESVTLHTTPLAAQKYYVEVSGGEGFGDSYHLRVGGAPGTFAPYAEIAARCARASRSLKVARTRLGGAQARAQRSLARLRRARHAPPRVRRAARVAKRRTQARLRAARRAVAAAKLRREPWCSVEP